MLPRDHYLKQPFQDLTHFPNGFEKGGLSDIQARLVKKNGTLIQAICNDEVSDATADDLHILKVISNQSAPRNPVEQAWVKYLSLVKNLSTNAKNKTKAKQPKVDSQPETPNEAPKEKKSTKPKKDEPSAKSKSATPTVTTSKAPSPATKKPAKPKKPSGE